MAKNSKPVWILCPRCELNYIKKSDGYCHVCKKDMKLIKADEDDIGDLELCPICKINFVQSDEEICDSCKQELGMNVDDETKDKEISDWHKYIDDDDSEGDEDETENEYADTVYGEDELENTSGIEDFEFDEDLEKDMEDVEEDDDSDDEDDDDDDDGDVELDELDDEEDEDSTEE